MRNREKVKPRVGVAKFILREIFVIKNFSSEISSKTLFFKNDNLIVTYKSKDKSRLGLGSRVLKLENDGKTLVGKCLFMSSLRGGVAEKDFFGKKK